MQLATATNGGLSLTLARLRVWSCLVSQCQHLSMLCLKAYHCRGHEIVFKLFLKCHSEQTPIVLQDVAASSWCRQHCLHAIMRCLTLSHVWPRPKTGFIGWGSTSPSMWCASSLPAQSRSASSSCRYALLNLHDPQAASLCLDALVCYVRDLADWTSCQSFWSPLACGSHETHDTGHSKLSPAA